jgi:hypothetical protein
MRRPRVALCLVGLALAIGCGGEEETGSATLPDALGYVPRDATLVAVLPTDIESEQLERLHRLVAPALGQVASSGSLRESLAALARDEGLDFERDVEPLLGGSLVMSLGNADEDTALFVLETTDGPKAAEAARRLHLGKVAVDGDTVLFADAYEENADLLDEAIARRKAGDGFDPAEFARALGDDAGDDAVLQLYASPEFVTGFASGADLPWLNALRSAAASLTLGSDAIEGSLRIRTDPDGLGEEDLPLETGDETPEAPDVEGAINGANRNQSRTTVFLAQLARSAYPDSRFVREVEALEADLGISFEDEVLRQFDGPSASIAYADGRFGAVSEVDDPDRMRELLPRLAPRLPAVLRGLQGLGDEALIALLLFAPDAPLVPGALPLLEAGIEVRRIDDDLYEIFGLDEGDQPFGGAGTIVFGMIGDRFVVGTNVERARAAAELDVSEVDDAEGAAVGRSDLSTWANDRIEDLIGLPIARLGEAVGELEASTEGLEGELRIEVPEGLD